MASKGSSSSGSSGGKFGKISPSGPHETTRLLLDSARIAHETEEIGGRTAQEMKNQREMLEETGEHLDGMKRIAQAAKASIRKLHEKIFMKKIFLWSIILLLFVANVAIMITLIQNHGKLFK